MAGAVALVAGKRHAERRRHLIFAPGYHPGFGHDSSVGWRSVQEAEAAINQAKATVDASTLSTQASAAAAYHNAQSTQKVAESAKTALDIAQTAYDKTVLGYHNGLFPMTDVLNAQAALSQTRSAYTQALFDAGAAQETLDELVGATSTDHGINSVANMADSPSGTRSLVNPAP